ncbi:MAG: periplasmic heavy metal sensor [Bacteroidetes bacterium]|nr:periplasmic heavy metal sensor [Bacteroidota bacterium]
MKRLIFIAVILLWTNPAFAQNRPTDSDVRLLKKWKLIENLNLTEEQAEIFFPRVNKLENELEQIGKQKKGLYTEMDRMIENKEVDEKRVDEILNEVNNLEKKEADLLHEHMQDINDVLTPEQKAKYSVFEQRFRKELKNKARRSSVSNPGVKRK